ncbi:MAG TPA: DUF1684 domain-containing protein [Candidatus Limnocylindrales bacterium]|nr:DUF1684 domain-containing protein [Candidatus Limnocylindrales bacterium]
MTEHPHEHEHRHHISYEEAVRQYREDKDAAFRSLPDSPIPHAARASFTGLPYYDVDSGMVVEGLTLEPYQGAEPVRFDIPTSDGRLLPAERAGVFRFALDGTPLTLTAYRVVGSAEDASLFVPFLDATSGRETYGAGRYLDLEPDEDGSWTLDFNLAYHPSCVYDPQYSCPLTPAENRLPIRIEAGERLPAEGG